MTDHNNDDDRMKQLRPALDGITVLEVGSFIAAPFAATQLADMGARVIKVEGPTGDATRAVGPHLPGGESSPFARMNRNKESVRLDLKDERDKELFLRMAREADVLIENLRPGAMKRLGLGYDVIAELNPTIVYASASGWGQDGPLSMLPGLDIMAQARSGLMSVTGEPGGVPMKVGVPICDIVTALYVTIGILVALRARENTGLGQSIDVSLFESAVSLGVWEAGMYFGDGTVPTPNGNAHQSIAPYQAFRTSDGWVTIGAATQRLWVSLADVLDMPELTTRAEFADNAARFAHRADLIPLLEQRTRLRTTDEMLELLGAAGIPSAPINTYEDVFVDAHLSSRDFFWDVPGRDGVVRQVGSPVRLSRSTVVRRSAGPVLGADTERIRAEFGSDETESVEVAR